MIQQSTPESPAREEQAASASERSFAIVMAMALALLGSFNWWHDGRVWPWLGGIAALFLISAYFCPTVLRPLNWAWFKFGILLQAVVYPVVMGLLFYGVVLPTKFIVRAIGKDLLGLTIEPDRDSYWILRRPPGPAPETMKDQF